MSLTFRIEFKIFLHTHDCLHGVVPTCLTQLLTPHASARTWSGQMHRLHPSGTRLKTMGDRAACGITQLLPPAPAPRDNLMSQKPISCLTTTTQGLATGRRVPVTLQGVYAGSWYSYSLGSLEAGPEEVKKKYSKNKFLQRPRRREVL